MDYRERIKNLTEQIDSSLADFSAPREKVSQPTQISSEFLTNKEQGDWAEKTLLNGINQHCSNYIAVHYGKNDNINAGDEGFKDFFERYQEELDTIGKRPDLLIFKKTDFPYDTYDISSFHEEELEKIVPKAKCGIEVRSSAFLIDKYENYMNENILLATKNVLSEREYILRNYGSLLREKNEKMYQIVNSISVENIHTISFRTPSWRSTDKLSELSGELKKLKANLSEITAKRKFLSITPKVEDLKVVNTWIQKYNVPHFYVQVFFDRAYGISFERILQLISKPDLEGTDYFIESDVKNQGKTTIKICATKEANVLKQIDLPEHYSEMKELDRGRLLFYVKFMDSASTINTEEFERLLGFKLD